MLIHPSLERLSALRLVGMRQAFEEQLQLPEINTLSFEERFGLLIDRNGPARKSTADRRLKKATLRHRAAAVEMWTTAIRGVWISHSSPALHQSMGARSPQRFDRGSDRCRLKVG